MKANLLKLTCYIALLSASPSVWAQDTFNASLNYQGSTYAGPVLVPGNTLSYSDNVYFNFTTTSSQIDILFTGSAEFFSGSFNGIVLNEATGDPITYAALDAASTFAGLTAGDLTYNSGQIEVNLEGLTPSSGQNIIIDTTIVPEPTTLALAGLGGLGLLLFRRRK
jgi:hypothetical protein